VYLDTSAINHVCDAVGTNELKQLREKAANQDLDICLSPVNIWEIIMCSDEGRREQLVYTVQSICGPRLMAEPEWTSPGSIDTSWVIIEA
jgi:PIN domain nuclease of toxin-antitoxin system